MADQQFDILIKFGLDPAKAREAVSEIKKVETATAKSNQTARAGAADLSKTTADLRQNVVQNAKATEESIKVDKQKFASLKDVKEGFKGIALQIPGIGRFAALLNPFTAAVAGIAAATQTWKFRNDELVKSLGGVALPDVTESAIERAERMATAIGKIASAAEKIKNEKEGFDRMVDVVNAFGLAAGLTDPKAVAEMKANNARAAGEASAASAAANLGAAGNINADNKVPAEMQELATAAEAQIPDVKKRIEFIQRAQSRRSMFGLNPLKMWDDMIYGARYGGASTYEEGLSMEQERLGGLRDTVARSTNITTNRAARLRMRSQGKSEFADAAGYFDQAASLGAGMSSMLGKDFNKAAGDIDGSILKSVNATLRLAAAMEANARIQDKSARDQENANRIRSQQQ